MEKYIKIFFFLLLLGLTTMTTACVESNTETINNGEIIVENNTNYNNMNVCGVNMAINSLIRLVDKNTNNKNINVNNNTCETSECLINVSGINYSTSSLKNSTNNGNIQINNNSNYKLYYDGVTINTDSIENCKHTGKIIVNGTEQ